MRNKEKQYWMTLDEVAAMMGISYRAAQTMVCRNKFPVKTYMLGRRRVADRDVVYKYFEAKRAEGLEALQKETPPIQKDGRRRARGAYKPKIEEKKEP